MAMELATLRERLKKGNTICLGGQLYIVDIVTSTGRFILKEASWCHKLWWWVCLR